MPESSRDVAHLVLQLCAAKEPDGLFYPRVDAAGLDLDRTRLDAALDQLRLNGFLEIDDWTQTRGQGYRLTDAGWQALRRPDLLDRPASRPRDVIPIRRERASQADEIRRSVQFPPLAVATRALVAVNIAVYVLTCVYMVQSGISFNDVLNGRFWMQVPGHGVVGIVTPGALWPAEVRAGRWWQLFTYMFQHGNLIHIAVNMFCLITLGNILEGRWGWKRFLILYLGSGLIGGIAIALFSEGETVGASGAIAGLLTSLGVWAWMYREHLPPHFVEAHFRMVGINLLILIGSGFMMPNISMSGHVGGALGGAILSVPLAWLSPFSPPRRRALGVASLILIAVAGVLTLEFAPRPDHREALEIRAIPEFRRR